jgi:hypothetical protein
VHFYPSCNTKKPALFLYLCLLGGIEINNLSIASYNHLNNSNVPKGNETEGFITYCLTSKQSNPYECSVGFYLEKMMQTSKQKSDESITALWSHINRFKNQLIALERTANSIDYEVYEMSSNSIFQFEGYNLNEGLEMMYSILSRRIHYLNTKEGINEN